MTPTRRIAKNIKVEAAGAATEIWEIILKIRREQGGGILYGVALLGLSYNYLKLS